jgi:hypothetical protein
MDSLSKQIGLENRKEILPQPNIPDKVPGIFGPDYSFADNIPLPGQMMVRDDNTINSVIDATAAAAAYVDIIAFGAPQSQLSNQWTTRPFVKPYGVNTWIRTGMKCSNGADMWTYLEGIPKGDALGGRVGKGLTQLGMPLKGLAPGMMEDAKAALDPTPVMGAVFGKGTPVCRLTTMNVGDQDGRFRNPESDKYGNLGAYYVEDPKTVFCSNGQKPDLQSGTCPGGGQPQQKRWAQAGELSFDAYSAAINKPTHCPSGYSIKNYRDEDCTKGLNTTNPTEGFACPYASGGPMEYIKMIGAAAGVMLIIGAFYRLSKNDSA